ncbi:MAG: hypothetical protein AB1762_19080 [Gemmatimonadota bacterium]
MDTSIAASVLSAQRRTMPVVWAASRAPVDADPLNEPESTERVKIGRTSRNIILGVWRSPLPNWIEPRDLVEHSARATN